MYPAFPSMAFLPLDGQEYTHIRCPTTFEAENRTARGVNSVAEAYCVKCKAKKEMAKAQEVTMKNGRPAMQGVCPDCGTKLFRIMGGKK